MKKESHGKCETLFAREDFCDFSKEFENLISLGKFKEIEESKEEICINKDALSNGMRVQKILIKYKEYDSID